MEGSLSGRRILEALAAGKTDPEQLVTLADRRLKADKQTLLDALQGRFTRHHAFLVREHLAMIDHIDQRIGDFEREVDALLAPFQRTVEHLMEIPGVKRRATMEDSIAAADVALSAADLAALDAAAPRGGTSGPRYGERGMRMVRA